MRRWHGVRGCAPASGWRGMRGCATRRSGSRGLRLAAVAIATLGVAGVAQGVWIHAKARLGQALIARAWKHSRPGGEGSEPLRPWPWADTGPVARLQVPELGVDVFVLNGGTGRTLAWGPGHLAGTALPGGPGNAVIGGHRDTHFAFLRDLAIGSEILAEDRAGHRRRYRVVRRFVTDEHDARVLAQDVDGARLTLVTCWPFDAVEVGGPDRFVVIAVDADPAAPRPAGLDGPGATPPRSSGSARRGPALPRGDARARRAARQRRDLASRSAIGTNRPAFIA